MTRAGILLLLSLTLPLCLLQSPDARHILCGRRIGCRVYRRIHRTKPTEWSAHATSFCISDFRPKCLISARRCCQRVRTEGRGNCVVLISDFVSKSGTATSRTAGEMRERRLQIRWRQVICQPSWHTVFRGRSFSGVRGKYADLRCKATGTSSRSTRQ